MPRARSQIKVHESTKEKVRDAALMIGLTQGEIVEQAVDQYVRHHREEFVHRMERTREALHGSRAAVLAYSAGVSEVDLARVGGTSSVRGSPVDSR
jgi:uncharacterized protein DUF6507